MSITLDIKTLGIEKITDRLERIRRRADNNRAMLGKMAVLGFKDIQQHFRDERGPHGKWPSLSPNTVSARRKGSGRTGKRRSKIKSKFKTRMLQDTGRLRNSFMPTGGRRRFLPNSVVLFTDVEYAGIHNFGGKAGRNQSVKIPKREFMWISESAKRQMGEIARRHVIHGT